MDEKEELKELDKEINYLDKRLSPLRDRRNEINNKKDQLERQKMVGKCFKYKNSGGGYDKNWNVYHKIIGIGGYHLESINVELPQNDVIVSILKQSSRNFFEQYCEEISEKIFSGKLKEAIEKIKKSEKS